MTGEVLVLAVGRRRGSKHKEVRFFTAVNDTQQALAAQRTLAAKYYKTHCCNTRTLHGVDGVLLYTVRVCG